MFAYCNNNPVMCSDPSGESLIGAIILTGAIVGGILGAFSAASTGGNVIEGAIEGALTGALGSACGILISNPVTAVLVAGLGGAAIDIATQATSQYVTTGQINASQIDLGRSAKTAFTTALGTAIPQFGEGTGNACDAFGTALIWAEGSALITCADVIITNCTSASRSSSYVATSHRGGFSQVYIAY